MKYRKVIGIVTEFEAHLEGSPQPLHCLKTPYIL
jgi:hypothetical protein